MGTKPIHSWRVTGSRSFKKFSFAFSWSKVRIFCICEELNLYYIKYITKERDDSSIGKNSISITYVGIDVLQFCHIVTVQIVRIANSSYDGLSLYQNLDLLYLRYDHSLVYFLNSSVFRYSIHPHWLIDHINKCISNIVNYFNWL